MLCFLAGMEQFDSYAAGWFCLSRCTSRCIPSCCPQAPDALRRGRYGPEGLYCSFSYFYVVYSDRADDSRPALRVAGFTGDDTSLAVFFCCLRAQDDRHFGRHGPEGQLRRRGQGLRSRSPWCGARVHCRMWIWRRRQGLRSRSPGFGARVHCRMLQLINKVVTPCHVAEVPQVVHGSSVAGVEKTVKIPQLQLVGGAVLG